MNDELIVSNDKKATPIYLYLWRTKSKLLKPMQIDVLTARSVKGVPGKLNPSRVAELCKCLSRAITTAGRGRPTGTFYRT